MKFSEFKKWVETHPSDEANELVTYIDNRLSSKKGLELILGVTSTIDMSDEIPSQVGWKVKEIMKKYKQ